MNLDFLNDFKDARALDAELGCQKYIIEDCSRSRYDQVAGRVSKIASLIQRRHIGNNVFSTYRTTNGNLIVYYTDYNRMITVIWDPLNGRTEPPFTPVEYKAACAPALGVLSPEYSEKNPDNGLSLVFTLPDGSFIAYDGGYEEDAGNTLRYLTANNKIAGELPHIRAWILTHGHIDHIGGFMAFAEKYSSLIKLDQIVCCPAPPSLGLRANGDALTEEFVKETAEKFGADIVHVHTGQLLCYPGAEIEVLYTAEDVIPREAHWLNEASLVTRVHIAGQKILVSADTEQSSDTVLTNTYGDCLKSDILQVPHHGFSGGSPKMYDLIRPDVAIWTTSMEHFKQRILPTWRHAPNLYLLNMVKEYFVADGENKNLPLPYKAK